MGMDIIALYGQDWMRFLSLEEQIEECLEIERQAVEQFLISVGVETCQ